jgi:hypothetical protein
MKNKRQYISIAGFILLILLSVNSFMNNKTHMFASSMEKDIERFWDKDIVIREVRDFEAYGKRFKLILSTAANNVKYKHMNYYEEKLGGLYYKNYQASYQGGSRALFSFSTVYVNGSSEPYKENWFTVVYGYNKDLAVESYEMEISGHKDNVVSSVEGKEYFLDAYEGRFQKLISATGKEGRDMLDVFND